MKHHRSILTLRLPDDLRAAVVAYAADDCCRESVAVRDLIERGLASVGKPVERSGEEQAK